MYALVIIAESAVIPPVKIMASLNETKVPDIQYPEENDASIDFYLETCKLVQANTVLTELIKQTIQEKYALSEKIIRISEQIKKMEARNAKWLLWYYLLFIRIFTPWPLPKDFGSG